MPSRVRSHGLVAAAIAGVLLGGSCGGSSNSGSGSNSAGNLSCPIKIGAAVHLTGPVATYDAPPVQGAELAIKELNDKGGVRGCKLQLIKTDGKSDIAKVGDAAVAAIQEGAQILIAPCDFDYGSPVGRVAQQHGIVGISECASSSRYSSTVLGDKQFTMADWNNRTAATSAEHTCAKMGWKRAITVVDSFTSFTKLLGSYWTDAYRHAGCQVVQNFGYTKGEMAFASQTQKIAALGNSYDAILITADMPDVSVIVRSLRAAGITAPIVGAGNMDTGEFYKSLGSDAGNNIYVTSLYWMGSETGPDMDHFIQAFNTMFGKKPDNGLYVMGYNLVNVLAQAITKSDSVKGSALAAALEGTQFTIVGGHESWTSASKGHEPAMPLAIVTLMHGQLGFGGSFTATYVPAVQG